MCIYLGIEYLYRNKQKRNNGCLWGGVRVGKEIYFISFKFSNCYMHPSHNYALAYLELPLLRLQLQAWRRRVRLSPVRGDRVSSNIPSLIRQEPSMSEPPKNSGKITERTECSQQGRGGRIRNGSCFPRSSSLQRTPPAFWKTSSQMGTAGNTYSFRHRVSVECRQALCCSWSSDSPDGRGRDSPWRECEMLCRGHRELTDSDIQTQERIRLT